MTDTNSSRPPSKGLGGLNALLVTGGAPPSRSGTQSKSPLLPSSRNGSLPTRAGSNGSRLRTGTGLKTAGRPEEILTQQIIKHMRAKLGDDAFNVTSQEIIADEVKLFVNSQGQIKDSDMPILESRIRARMSGSTPLMSTMTVDKRMSVYNDAWTKIFKYNNALNKEEDKRFSQLQLERRDMMREAMQLAMQEKEAERQMMAKEKKNALEAEQRMYGDFVAEEEARTTLQNQILEKLRQERMEQLQEKQTRVQAAIERKRLDESKMTSKIAYETKRDFFEEERKNKEAKAAVKALLWQNEANKKLKEDDRLRLQEENVKSMAAHTEMLDKWERTRQEKLAETKRSVARSEAMAGALEKRRQWMPDTLIEKHLRDANEAAELAEKKRDDAHAASEQTCQKALEAQMKERKATREAQLAAETEAGRRELERLKAEAEAGKIASFNANSKKKNQIRVSLEEQMMQSARRRQFVYMTDLEKHINKGLLEKALIYDRTGQVTSSWG